MKRTHIRNTLIAVSFLSAMCFGMPAAATVPIVNNICDNGCAKFKGDSVREYNQCYSSCLAKTSAHKTKASGAVW
jgi:hypothetical protein